MPSISVCDMGISCSLRTSYYIAEKPFSQGPTIHRVHNLARQLGSETAEQGMTSVLLN